MTDVPQQSETSSNEVDLSGRQLGDYRLLRRLGRGGMADVYLAEQESLHRRVAFKALKNSLARDTSYVRRFLNEAQAAASLVHANIVQIHEVGCQDGVHFIAQEYVEGQNLRQLLQRRGALDVPTAVHILRHIAAALHKAAQQKITHRDIKPENILVSTTGEVKVADFGLARVEREGAVELTQIGMTVGTPLYMSPEQVEGRPVDARSDIYSLGVTTYHMLAGRPPFQGDTPFNIAVQHLHKEPARLEDLRPEVPSGLCRIVHKMLAKDPPERYRDAMELLKELRALSIAGLDSSWAQGIDTWDSPELGKLAGSRIAATQQLDAVLRREHALQRTSRWALKFVAVLLAAFLFGGAGAWATRTGALLQVSDADLPRIERQPTVRDQYLYAAELGSEQAWNSVGLYFPARESAQNQYYVLRATQRLAEFYLARGDSEQAWKCFEILARQDATQAEFRALGLAGEANLLLARDEPQLARQKLAALVQPFAELPSRTRERLLAELNAELRPVLQQLYQETQPPKKRGP